MRLNVFGVGDGISTPAVVGLAGEVEYPARDRHGDPVSSQLAHERVTPFPGRFDCDKYAAARRSRRSLLKQLDPPGLTQFGRLTGRLSRLSPLVDIGLAHPLRQRHRMHPEISGDLLDRHTIITVTGYPDNIVTELPRVRPCAEYSGAQCHD